MQCSVSDDGGLTWSAMMRRGKLLLESSRQGSIDGNASVSDKELVHKCHSDPGGGQALGGAPRTQRHRSTSGAPRKCVLTLDGYSYVIGKTHVCFGSFLLEFLLLR